MSGVSAVQHVFVVGSKGIPGSYGGYETFVDRLTEYHEGEPGLRYHVACKSLSESGEFSYHNARCFRVRVPQIGPAQAIWYDVAALADCVAYIRRNRIPHPIVYVLACRIGPFTAHFARAVHRLGGKLYVNPDGHEWMRAKWSAPVRRYWKVSERMMTKHADLMVCDSVNMEKYIRESTRGTVRRQRSSPTERRTGGASGGRRPEAPGLVQVEGFGAEVVLPGGWPVRAGEQLRDHDPRVHGEQLEEGLRAGDERERQVPRGVEGEDALRPGPAHQVRGHRVRQGASDEDPRGSVRVLPWPRGGRHEPSLLEALASTDLNLLLGVASTARSRRTPRCTGLRSPATGRPD